MRTTRLPILLFLAAWAALPVRAVADSSAVRPAAPVGPAPVVDPAADFEMPAIEVRTRRAFPRPEADRAAAASVLPREELERPGVDLSTVLETTPGVDVTRLGGLGSFATVSIRGSTGEQVRVYVDGVLRNAADGGAVDLSALPLGPIERVEVYRSVAPVGFGSSVIGGVVRIRTRQAEERQLEFQVGAGSFGTRRARVFYAEPGEIADLVLALDYEGTTGDFPFRDDNGTAWTSDDDRTTLRRNAGFDALSGLGRVRLRLGEHTTLSVQEDVRWRDRGLPGLAQFETTRAALAELEGVTTFSAEWRGEGPADAAPVWETRGTFTFLRRQLDDPLAEIGLGRKDTDDWSYSARAGTSLRWPILGFLAPAVALDWRYERFTPENAFATPPSGAESGRHVFEGAAEVVVDVAPIRTTLIPSVGVDVALSRLFSRDAFGQDPDERRDVTDAEWSARLGIANEALPWTIVKLNGGRSVRLPSLFELFGDTGYVRGNPALLPETAWFFDAGVVHDAGWLPSPNRLEIEVFGFWSRVSDLIQLVQTAQNVSRAENVDAAELAGVELAARADLFRHVRLRSSFTWLFSEDVSDVAARAGKELPYRPRYRWFARVEGYGGWGGDVPEAGLFVEADGMAGNHLDPANLVRTSARAFLAVGAYGWFLDRRLRLEIVARNVLGERAVDLASFPLPGRSVFASIQWKAF